MNVRIVGWMERGDGGRDVSSDLWINSFTLSSMHMILVDEICV